VAWGLLPRRFHQLFQLLTLATPPSDGVYHSSHTVAELSRHSFVPVRGAANKVVFYGRTSCDNHNGIDGQLIV